MNRLRPRARALRHLLAISVLAAAVATGVGPLANPAPVSASTASDMEFQLLSLINDARVKKGLVPLYYYSKLWDIAGSHSSSMASKRSMYHTSCLGCVLNSYDVQRYMSGEIIAYTSYPWGSQAATSIFNGWKSSSLHWSMLMSNKFNYIGLGVALGSNGKTYATGVMTESVDHTRPWAKMKTVARSGSTVTWSWAGADTPLQTHMAGLKNFDVQYRVGSGTWSTIRSGTTAKSLSLTNRGSGQYYGLRVRARDNRGAVSAWSAEMRILLP